MVLLARYVLARILHEIVEKKKITEMNLHMFLRAFCFACFIFLRTENVFESGAPAVNILRFYVSRRKNVGF